MPGLDGGRDETERLRRLVDAQPLDLAHHEDEPEIGRERADRLLEQGAQLGARKFGVRRRAAGGSAHELFPIIVKEGDRAVIDMSAPPSGGAGASERLVDDDPRQPGGKCRSALERSDCGEGTKIGALDSVFSFRPVAENAPGGAEEALVVALGDEPDGAGIAIGDE